MARWPELRDRSDFVMRTSALPRFAVVTVNGQVAVPTCGQVKLPARGRSRSHSAEVLTLGLAIARRRGFLTRRSSGAARRSARHRADPQAKIARTFRAATLDDPWRIHFEDGGGRGSGVIHVPSNLEMQPLDGESRTRVAMHDWGSDQVVARYVKRLELDPGWKDWVGDLEVEPLVSRLRDAVACR